VSYWEHQIPGPTGAAADWQNEVVDRIERLEQQAHSFRETPFQAVSVDGMVLMRNRSDDGMHVIAKHGDLRVAVEFSAELVEKMAAELKRDR
jgi:hypothetical protein